MSLISTIRSAMSDIASQFADDALPIYYRAMTSSPTANPRTWGSWIAIPGSRVVNERDTTEFDPVRNEHVRRHSWELRVPFNTGLDLTRYNQVKLNASDRFYSVWEKMPSAGGSVDVYRIVYSEPVMANTRPGASL